MSGPYVLGIDAGTESVRAGIFDLTGRALAFGTAEYHVYHPRPGWAEQSPDEWWQALVGAVRSAVVAASVPPEEIIGLGCDATSCTVVFLDGRMQPLRPAILWMDVRASDQAQRAAATRHDALRYNGWGNVSAEWMPCKALWVKEREPQVYAPARHVGEYIDWINYRLTGEWGASINNTSIRWYYDHRRGGFPRDFYESLHLGDLIERFPSPVRPLGAVVGSLTPDAAEVLGLRPGIPVGQGGADAFIAMIGLNVVDPGRMAFITGSSHLQLGMSEQEVHGRGFFGAYPDAVVPGLATVEGGQVSTGSVVKWFKDHFCGYEAQEAASRGIDVYQLLDEKAQQIPPGAEGLIVLDYWQGNRTPLTDPDARGMIWGLSLKHGTGHVFRALLEGVAYGTEHILRVFREADFKVTEMVVSGGPAKSHLWMQLHADISNVPIIMTREPQAAALGSAILGAVAAGAFPSIQAAARTMVQEVGRIDPTPGAHEVYRFYVDQYIATYLQMRELLHAMVRHTAVS